MTDTSPTQERESEIVQERPEDAPPGWAAVQEALAVSSGLAILLTNGHQPPALLASNNNSICQAFQSSPRHASLCDPYCGEAHSRAMSTDSVAPYRCHAGLSCFAMRLPIGGETNLAAIGGRAFVTAADYTSLNERFHRGDLKDLLARAPFENVIFSEEQRLDQLADRLAQAARTFNNGSQQAVIAQSEPLETQRSAAVLESENQKLRSDLDYRSRLAESLQHFLERISSSDPAKTYVSILTNSKELLQANRASLLAFDEISNELTLKATFGFSAVLSEVSRLRLGEGISGGVLESGKPLVVQNLVRAGFEPAPLERNYQTQSFISYPITISGRKIGVLNLTDKSGGGNYTDVDLSLLEIIGLQVAVALERAGWQERASEFQLMSITDSLTGLPNRRYLEQRLTEELNRSKRYNYPMSFLMIDIDEFKSYNDLNGHQAGDLALQITSHCLKASLRAADVAARYGGEEFCILLPQTPIQEAKAIAERMRERLARTTYPHGGTQPLGSVTISIGVSTFAKHIDTAENIIAAADYALYNAKHQGKNRIAMYPDNLFLTAKS